MSCTTNTLSHSQQTSEPSRYVTNIKVNLAYTPSWVSKINYRSALLLRWGAFAYAGRQVIRQNIGTHASYHLRISYHIIYHLLIFNGVIF